MAQYGQTAATFRQQRSTTGKSGAGYRSAPPIMETDPSTGNLRPAGGAPAAAAPTDAPAFTQSYASTPRPAGGNTASTVLGSVAQTLAGKALTKGAGKVWDYAKSQFSTPTSNSITATQDADEAGALTPNTTGLEGSAGDAGGASSIGTDWAGESGAGGGAGSAFDTGGASEFGGSPVNEFDFGGGSEFGGAPAAGADAAGAGADAAGDALGGGGSYAGAVIDVAQGNYGKAAGTVIGTAIGNAVFPVVGGIVGGFIGGAIGGGCFITQATMAAVGGGDEQNDPTLQCLRWFRDNIMLRDPRGEQMVKEYYAMAPQVAEAISMHPNAQQIFQGIYTQFLQPACQAIQQGNYQQALQLYSQMIAAVEPYAQEMSQYDDDYDEEGSDSMGSHAALVGNIPGMADDIAPVEFQHPADEEWSESQIDPQGTVQPDAPVLNPFSQSYARS